MESYARVDACWAERACRAGCAGQYARADLDSLSAGDLEPDVATRPAAIAAAAAAAEQQRQQQQRIPPARSRRGQVAHQKKQYREEAVLTHCGRATGHRTRTVDEWKRVICLMMLSLRSHCVCEINIKTSTPRTPQPSVIKKPYLG